jgi:hypothetical protein
MQYRFCVPRLVSFRHFSILLALALALMEIGCGTSAAPTPKPPVFSGNTSVTVVLSTTANDQLSEFGMVLQAVTLTNQSGNTVNLVSGPQGAEFMTINGGAMPFSTASIPQGIYTAAGVTLGSAQFTCLTVLGPGSVNPGGLDISTYAYGLTPPANVTVNLPLPITITGTSMGLSLDLLVAQSASYPSACYTPSITQYTITPNFNVTPIALSSQPTNSTNGKVSQLEGEIATISSGADSFTLSLPIVDLTCPCIQPAPLTVSADVNTEYQGIGAFSALAVGMLIDMDGTIQHDGSLLATRIAAYDPAALNVMTGPIVLVDLTTPTFQSLGRQQNGQTYSSQPQSLGGYTYVDSTSFQISGQLSNVASLPFNASFNGSNMVSGQNISVFSGAQNTSATNVTLMPQTINATIEGSSSNGDFKVYSVLLGSYDLFPTLAAQPGQRSLLTNPSVVEVYVDNNTQQLNSQLLAAGNTFRFYGLVFNDNGTLRMDCAEINDGVTATSQANSDLRPRDGESGTVTAHHTSIGPRALSTTMTQSHESLR